MSVLRTFREFLLLFFTKITVLLTLWGIFNNSGSTTNLMEEPNKQKLIYCKAPNYLQFVINTESSLGNDSIRFLRGKILEMNKETIKILPHYDIIEVEYLSLNPQEYFYYKV